MKNVKNLKNSTRERSNARLIEIYRKNDHFKNEHHRYRRPLLIVIRPNRIQSPRDRSFFRPTFRINFSLSPRVSPFTEYFSFLVLSSSFFLATLIHGTLSISILSFSFRLVATHRNSTVSPDRVLRWHIFGTRVEGNVTTVVKQASLNRATFSPKH